jgi:carboxylesterase
MRRALPGVRQPALVMHSRDDASVDPGDALRLHAALGSPRKELVWFEGSSHALLEDAQRAPVAQAAVDFIRRLPAEAA